MANKRDLKKKVKLICEDLATECMFAADYVKGVDANEMYGIVGKIATLQENALNRISFSFDKTPSVFNNRHDYHKAKKAYFKKAYDSFREKFNNHMQDVVKEMNGALPQEVKDANKKA